MVGVNRWQRLVKRLPEGGLLKDKVGRHGSKPVISNQVDLRGEFVRFRSTRVVPREKSLSSLYFLLRGARGLIFCPEMKIAD